MNSTLMMHVIIETMRYPIDVGLVDVRLFGSVAFFDGRLNTIDKTIGKSFVFRAKN